MLFVMKTLKDEGYIVIKAYKFTVFEILRDYYHILCVCAIPSYRVYRLCNRLYLCPAGYETCYILQKRSVLE